MTYGAHGPVVSLAARIMQQTPSGMVYVAEQIATELSSRVEFSVIGPTEFKGVDRAVTIYRATAVDGHGRSGTSRRLSEGDWSAVTRNEASWLPASPSSMQARAARF